MSKNYEDEILEYFKSYKEVGKKVKEIIKNLDSDAKILIFGSVVRGKYTASSDIDILVVTNKVEYKDRMRVEVYRQVKAPIELHITTPEKYRDWYLKFIEKDELYEIT